MKRLNGLFVLNPDAFRMVYGDALQSVIGERINLIASPQTAETIRKQPELLADVDLIFGGWGFPVMDEAFLTKAPRLKAIFYGAGAIGSWVTDAFWDRNILVTTASSANAIPVAEYTLATILFSLKHGWRLARQTLEQRRFVERDDAPGNFQRVIGLVSMGTIARLLLRYLQPFDLSVQVYDPFLSEIEAARLGVKKVSLETLFSTSDVVSIHAPELAETRGIIDGALLSSMKPGATFINTARGGLIREEQMIEMLRARPDLQAVLDVTEPEPPATDSPLYTLPNVMMTPHIAGSAGQECRRMGLYMVEELKRYLNGEPLQWQVRPDAAQQTCHRHARSKPAWPAAVAV